MYQSTSDKFQVSVHKFQETFDQEVKDVFFWTKVELIQEVYILFQLQLNITSVKGKLVNIFSELLELKVVQLYVNEELEFNVQFQKLLFFQKFNQDQITNVHQPPLVVISQ